MNRIFPEQLNYSLCLRFSNSLTLACARSFITSETEDTACQGKPVVYFDGK